MSAARELLSGAEIEALYAEGAGMKEFARRVEAAVLRRAVVMPGGCWTVEQVDGKYVVVSARITTKEWVDYLERKGGAS